jgi:predicted AlkP superfamily pyrophosphatase or phosphodiesterase
MGVPLPNLSTSEVIQSVINSTKSTLGDKKVEKCFVYAPDALGEALFRDFSSEYTPVTRLAPINVLLRSVLPPKTPVCFASMLTGALPEAHGIRKYEKPVLSCDTIFDALVRAGKKAAIVAVKDCSISIIFKNRAIDYFIEEYDPQVNDRLLKIFKNEDYDFILAYNQEYDDSLHKTVPRSEESLKAMRNHIKSFGLLAQDFLEQYKQYVRLVLFSPDHGAHIDSSTGKGDHGLDISDDMEVRSFWGIYDRNR